MTNDEFNEAFRKRTFAFAKDVLSFLRSVAFNSATRVMSDQLAKSATSVGANFRAFCRARSTNERYAKICIVVEEADETVYWLELFRESPYGNKDLLLPLIEEATVLLKVTAKIKHSHNRS
jgi:four helix bundle protein